MLLVNARDQEGIPRVRLAMARSLGQRAIIRGSPRMPNGLGQSAFS